MPVRIEKDFSNKSASSGVSLTKTFSYLGVCGLSNLKGGDLLMVYNLVRMRIIG